MFKTFSIPLTWSELFKRTYREFIADNCLGLAAQLAYYVLLALVPALIFVVALASFFPAHLIERAIESLSNVAPAEMAGLISTQLRSLADGDNGGLLTFGILMALWSSSSATASICDALNRAYDIDEGRPWWRVRLTAMALTVGLAVLILVAVTLVLAGPTIAEWIGAKVGLGAVFVWSWKILQWPFAVVLVALALAILNYFGPDAEQDWEWITPGSLLSAVLWLGASLLFKLYVANFGSYDETYGSLGAVIVMMLWFYLSGAVVLLGSEMNAEIEHASPQGKAAGEKVPGVKRQLGARAIRQLDEEQATARTAPDRQIKAPPSMVPRKTGWLFGLAELAVLVWLRRRRGGGHH